MVNDPADDLKRSTDLPAVQDEPTTEDVEREGFSLERSLRNPRTIISFVAAIAIIVFIFRGLDIDVAQIWSYIRNANIGLFLLAVAVFYATFPLRAFRWRLLLDNAGVPVQAGRRSWATLPALMEYIYLSWFANCIVPAKLGDAYRGYLLKHNGSVSFSRTFGTIFTERLLDMVMLFTLLVLSAWSVFGARVPENARWIFGFGLALVVAIVAGLAAMRFLSPFIRRLVPDRLESKYAAFEAGTLGALKPSRLPLLLGLTSLVWLCESLRLFLVIEALGGLSLGLPSAIFVALMGSLLTTVPATPGGLGVVEGGVTGVLSALFRVATPVAAAVAVLDRVINYWSIVFGGLIVYLLSKRK